MQNINDCLEKQRERLSKVCEYLKSKGISQRDIVDEVDITEDKLSHLKSGKILHITDEFLDKLHDSYNINPKYIRLESDIMIDISGTKLENFESFVDSWDTVKRGDKSYLHITMDRNFYKFLISVDKAKLLLKNSSVLEDEINRLRTESILDDSPEEFVVIPKNSFIEIIQEEKEDRKNLNEVIDFLEHIDYCDDEE